MRRMHAVITAGGTSEPIDDVRAVTNASTGRLGAAIATALFHRGIDVTVIGSPMLLRTPGALPKGVRTLPFSSTTSLDDALTEALAQPTDLVFMAAAVSDYAPVPATGKIRSNADALDVHMTRTPKILPTLRGRAGDDAVIVGFKLLSGVSDDTLVAVAQAQRADNHLDLTVANDAQQLGPHAHPVWLVGDAVRQATGHRQQTAEAIADAALACRPQPTATWPFPAAEGPCVGRARRWSWLPRAWSASTPEAPSPAAAIAHRRHVPDLPVLVPHGEGAWLGCADHDHRTWWPAMTAATATLGIAPTDARWLWHLGVPVAALDPTTARLAATGLGDAPRWLTACAPALPDRARFQGVQPRDLHAVGWTEDGTHWRAPWAYAPRPAASACLVHLPTRSVLVGTRLQPPAQGGVAFPGGKAHAGEAAEACARRELLEETGLHAPEGAPWFTRTIWAGIDPTWAITAHAWPVPVRDAPAPTPSFHAEWRSVDAVMDDPATLPGVQAILAQITAALETL